MSKPGSNMTGVMFGWLSPSLLYRLIIDVTDQDDRKRLLNLYREALKMGEAGFPDGFWIARPLGYENYLTSEQTITKEEES